MVNVLENKIAIESEVAEIYIIFSFRQIDDTFYLTKRNKTYLSPTELKATS